VVDGRLHPALNLVSAQLIAGSPDAPTFVNADEIAKWPKGPTVGIMGAPMDPPRVTSPEVSRWSVCDTASTTVTGTTVTGINGARRWVRPTSSAPIRHCSCLTAIRRTSSAVVRMPIDLSDHAVTGRLVFSLTRWCREYRGHSTTPFRRAVRW
jgi:hypothetical protein